MNDKKLQKFMDEESARLEALECEDRGTPPVLPACPAVIIPGPPLREVLVMLVEVARRAYFLCDDTCEENGVLTVDPESFDALSKALDRLDELPEPEPNVYGTGPAKAEAYLRSIEVGGRNG